MPDRDPLTLAAAAPSASFPKLALYLSETCGYCWRVQQAIRRLGVSVELRDIWAQASHRNELLQARKRGTVPVLRIETEAGHVSWMPESRDIIRYLENYAGGANGTAS